LVLIFFWPCPYGNPYYDQIPQNTDILVTHGPVQGYVDNTAGCPALLEHVKRVKPKLVVCGHIHSAHGSLKGKDDLQDTTFVNAANCFEGYTIGWEPIVVAVTPKQ